LTSVAAVCEHGAECHSGAGPSAASAPEASRAWLLIEHPGPWPHEATDAALPPALGGRDLKELATGVAPSFGSWWPDPVYLVCTHGKRSVCCARFGGPLAQALAARHPGQVWETTHVGGHRFAANLVILPHGLYYGPVDRDAALAAIGAYRRGAVVASRYRGRAGQPREEQEAEYGRLLAGGSLPLGLTRPVPAG
jgi:hypothetical protein